MAIRRSSNERVCVSVCEGERWRERDAPIAREGTDVPLVERAAGCARTIILEKDV